MGKGKRIIYISILLFFAIVLLILGVFLDNVCGFFRKTTNPIDLNDMNIGNAIEVEFIDNFMETDDKLFLVTYYNEEETIYSSLYVEVPDSLHTRFFNLSNNNSNKYTFTGIVRSADDDLQNMVFDCELKYYVKVLTYVEPGYELSDADVEELHSMVSPYYIELVSINETSNDNVRLILCGIGVVFLLVAVVLIISSLTKASIAKVAIITAVIIFLPMFIVGAILINKIRTVASVENRGNGLYEMTSYHDLKTDKLLEANVSSVEELVDWVSREQLYGMPIDIDLSDYGCATIACRNSDDDVIFGRNMDYYDTDTLVIYNNPRNGYASFAVADLDTIGINEYDGIDPNSYLGKLCMMIAPYACVDGMNEAGLGVGVLELDIGELHQDNGKPDLLYYTIVRILLDNCANVDEAIELLSQYDIHTALGVRYHIQIVDKTGRSVVVEWLDNEMFVNELCAATNSVLTPGEYYGMGDADERLQILNTALENSNGIMSEDEVRDTMAAVAQGTFTEWTSVYNLNDFSFTVYIDGDYDNGYSFK